MSIKGFLIILYKHILNHWLRILLSSFGIMIGVWAIILTATISSGLQNQLQKAINSQPFVKTVQAYKETTGVNSVLDIRPDSRFTAIPYSTLTELATSDDNIIDYAPSDLATIFVNLNPGQTNCVNESIQTILNNRQQQDTITPNNCQLQQIINVPFEFFYQSLKTNWAGQTSKPEKGQIIACFVCDETAPLYKFLGVSNPEELIGRRISIEINSINNQPKTGDSLELSQLLPSQSQFKESKILDYQIVSVIDDRTNSTGLSAQFQNYFFTPREFYIQAINQLDPTISPDQKGYTELNFFTKDISKIKNTISNLKNKGFFVVSTGQILSNSISTSFLVISIVLGIFAVIALFASIFGIVNVMIVSVLQRAKEIGILKSLGAKNKDIFSIFLSESLYIGVFGWLLGWGLSVLTTAGITQIFDFYLSQNPTFAENLKQLDIISLSLPISANILFLTLAIAILFTLIAGLIPSLNAAKTNPTEVLRSE